MLAKVRTLALFGSFTKDVYKRQEEIIPGQRLTYSFAMVPTDYSLKKGHKLALILYGIDAQQTLRPDTVTRIEIPLDSIQVQVPLLR